MSAKRPQPRANRRASDNRRQMGAWQAYGCKEAYGNSTQTDAWSSERSQAIVFGASAQQVSNTMRVLSLRLAGLLVILASLSLSKRVL